MGLAKIKPSREDLERDYGNNTAAFCSRKYKINRSTLEAWLHFYKIEKKKYKRVKSKKEDLDIIEQVDRLILSMATKRKNNAKGAMFVKKFAKIKPDKEELEHDYNTRNTTFCCCKYKVGRKVLMKWLDSYQIGRRKGK
jgi:hypothetical protein